jgi:hypothetical protein
MFCRLCSTGAVCRRQHLYKHFFLYSSKYPIISGGFVSLKILLRKIFAKQDISAACWGPGNSRGFVPEKNGQRGQKGAA